MKRALPISTLVLCAALTLASAIPHAHALPGDPSPVDDLVDLCAAGATEAVHLTEDAANDPCADFTDYDVMPASAVELRAAETNPPNPLDALPIRLVDFSTEDAALHSYAKLVGGDVPIYDAPGGNVIGNTGDGFIFYTTGGSQAAGDKMWTMINPGQWVEQNALMWRSPTQFKGVFIEEWPEREFGWMLDPHQPLLTPGGLPNKDAPFLERYHMVTIYATAWVGGWRYYMIAPKQWVRETWMGKVRMNPVPEGIEGKWFDIDLYEQTLVAYEDERPIFATLVASGLQQWSTTEGVFQIYYRVENAPMSGAHGEPDYYYLENVPYSLYFNEGAAIHGAYWHDGFGYRRSHGCVNVAPADAMTLFDWAEEGTWVHVHSSAEYR